MNLSYPSQPGFRQAPRRNEAETRVLLATPTPQIHLTGGLRGVGAALERLEVDRSTLSMIMWAAQDDHRHYLDLRAKNGTASSEGLSPEASVIGFARAYA
jgi:hypothetical protein